MHAHLDENYINLEDQVAEKAKQYAASIGMTLSNFTSLALKSLLTRTFHGDWSRGAAQPDADKEADALRRRLYVSYRPRSTARLTPYPSGSRKPQQDYREMFGLTCCSGYRAWMYLGKER